MSDANGIPTEVARDGDGNVIRRMQQADAASDLWHVEVFTYNTAGQQTEVYQPFEATGNARYTDEPQTPQSTSTYDPDTGRLTATTTAPGTADEATTYYHYDAYGRPTVITDPLGNTTRNAYDSHGNLTQTTDAAGHITKYSYDGNGNLTQLVQVDGAGNDIIQATYAYAGGRLVSSTDATGQSRYFAYDSAGNQTHSWHAWTNPDDANDQKTLLSVSAYDAEGHVIGSASTRSPAPTPAPTPTASPSSPPRPPIRMHGPATPTGSPSPPTTPRVR